MPTHEDSNPPAMPVYQYGLVVNSTIASQLFTNRYRQSTIMSLDSNVAKVVKELRTSKGIAQSELAESIGTSRPYMSLMERGRRPISLDTLELIADALGVKPATIISRADKDARK